MTLQIGTDGSIVTNTTSIIDAPAVQITGGGVRFTNSGTGRLSSSTPTGPAILIQGVGTTIINQVGGFISGSGANGVAIQGSAGTDTILNTGTINGQVLLGDGNDSYTQRSVVGSDLRIDLGGGNDLYRHEVASTGFSQQVFGGDGYDRVQLTVYGRNTMYGDLFAGFEQLEISKSTGIWNLDGFDNYQAVLLAAGGDYNFLYSANPDADLAVSGGSLLIGRYSAFRDITGSLGTDQVYVENGTFRSANLGAGNDVFRYGQQLRVGQATTIVGIVDGGTGADMLEINVDGGATVDVGNFVGFETLDSGSYTASVDDYRLVNANGFTSFKIGFKDTVSLAHSNLASAPVYLAYQVSLTLEATATVGSVSLLGGSTGTAGDPTKWINVVNNGSVIGNVDLGVGDDNYDGRLGAVGGTVYGHAGDDLLRGGSAADRLVGGLGNDRLEGDAGNDTLTGDAGDDHLDGGLGSDSLRGGSGNDTYMVGAGDSVFESLGEGFDTVQASADHQLGANVENLTLGGTATAGTGNGLANVITGNGADNRLDGKGGDDRLNGGGGNDILAADYSGATATLTGGAGDDQLRGNASSTIAAFSGARADYAFAVDAAGKLVVRDTRDGSPDGTDTLAGIATLQFSDGAVPVDAVIPNRAPTGVELTNVVSTAAENGDSFKVADVAAADDGRGSNSYALAGDDHAAFELRTNAAGGTELWFVASTNAEARTSYRVQVQVDDPTVGGAPDASATFTLTISDVDEADVTAPVDVDGDAGGSIAENAIGSVGIIVSSADPDATTNRISYSLVRSDGTAARTAGNFAIDGLTGEVSLTTAFDREAVGAEGTVGITVRASSEDGSSADTPFTVTVENVNEGVTISSASAFDIAENARAVASVTADDPDGDAITYSLSGGADAALFAIDAATGALGFIAAPDYESPRDADGDGVYDVVVSASDGSLVDTRTLSVTVANVVEAPVITSDGAGDAAALDVAENAVAVTTVTAAGGEAGPLSFAIAGGADAARFAIDAATGALRFVDAPNHEVADDAGGDNVYDVVVSADNGARLDTQAMAVRVRGVDEAPVIGATTAFAIGENATAAGIVGASDPEGAPIVYAIAGGADAGLFAIDAATGALRFLAAPDFEAPADADGDNAYDVVVSASDGTLSDTRILSVIVTDADERAVITSSGGADAAAFTVSENGRAVAAIAARDPDGTTVTYAIAGGADAARFAIDAVTGALSFVAAPDFEAADDVGADGTYDVVVSAGTGDLVDTQAVAVRVADVDEAPTFAAPGSSLLARENGTVAGTVRASDPDGDPLAYAIGGGADGALFAIDAGSGALRFLNAPDFESAADSDRDGVYDVVVTASDGRTTASQSVAVRVSDVDEALSITSNGGGAVASVSVAENSRSVLTVAATDPDRGTIAYSIAGGADAARFAIDGRTGALSFVSAPNHEAPTDANGDNVYDVVVRASDGAFADEQAVAVTVANVAEGATIFGTSANNTITTTTTVTGQSRATALEDAIYGGGGADTISGGGGADVIDGGTGNDVLRGQGGAERLTGGAGADSFVFDFASESAAGAADVVTDFSRSDRDRISVNPIDANVNLSGNQNFAFIGTGAFTGAAGQLRFEQVNGNTFVSGDTNGDRIADFLIEVAGRVDLIASDFVL